MEQQFKSQIYYAFRAFLIILSIFLGLLALTVFVGIKLNNAASATVLTICILSMPFLFIRKIKSHSTKDALVQFDTLHFSISLSKLGKNEITKVLSWKWEEIKAYKFYFTPSKLTYLDLYLRNGKRYEFGFKENKTQSEILNDKQLSLFGIFRSYVRQYNAGKDMENQIALTPGFLTTKTGTLWLSLIAVLITVAIVILIFKNAHSAGLLIIGASIFLGLLVKRKRDRDLYKQISEME